MSSRNAIHRHGQRPSLLHTLAFVLVSRPGLMASPAARPVLEALRTALIVFVGLAVWVGAAREGLRLPTDQAVEAKVLAIWHSKRRPDPFLDGSTPAGRDLILRRSEGLAEARKPDDHRWIVALRLNGHAEPMLFDNMKGSVDSRWVHDHPPDSDVRPGARLTVYVSGSPDDPELRFDPTPSSLWIIFLTMIALGTLLSMEDLRDALALRWRGLADEFKGEPAMTPTPTSRPELYSACAVGFGNSFSEFALTALIGLPAILHGSLLGAFWLVAPTALFAIVVASALSYLRALRAFRDWHGIALVARGMEELGPDRSFTLELIDRRGDRVNGASQASWSLELARVEDEESSDEWQIRDVSRARELRSIAPGRWEIWLPMDWLPREIDVEEGTRRGWSLFLRRPEGSARFDLADLRLPEPIRRPAKSPSSLTAELRGRTDGLNEHVKLCGRLTTAWTGGNVLHSSLFLLLVLLSSLRFPTPDEFDVSLHHATLLFAIPALAPMLFTAMGLSSARSLQRFVHSHRVELRRGDTLRWRGRAIHADTMISRHLAAFGLLTGGEPTITLSWGPPVFPELDSRWRLRLGAWIAKALSLTAVDRSGFSIRQELRRQNDELRHRYTVRQLLAGIDEDSRWTGDRRLDLQHELW